MEVTGTNDTNGAKSNYTVSWTAAIPMVNGDTFHMKFPTEVVVEKSASDPLFKEITASYDAFRKDYQIWSSRAYLKQGVKY
jgi:TRAP-type mannitol/chloroaromatic compound transport system substrate-binding protein